MIFVGFLRRAKVSCSLFLFFSLHDQHIHNIVHLTRSETMQKKKGTTEQQKSITHRLQQRLRGAPRCAEPRPASRAPGAPGQCPYLPGARPRSGDQRRRCSRSLGAPEGRKVYAFSVFFLCFFSFSESDAASEKMKKLFVSDSLLFFSSPLSKRERGKRAEKKENSCSVFSKSSFS